MTTSEQQPRRRGRPPSGGREAILEATLELLRERGIANLTSRDVAARAGVSDASVYYHFGDRLGLLQAVFEHGLPLRFMMERNLETMSRSEVLATALQSLDGFFGDIVPILHAAQSDRELGASFAAYMQRQNIGPQRGVAILSSYLRDEQAAGRANPDVDVEAVAMILIDYAFRRAVMRGALPHVEAHLPSADRMLATVNRMLD